jgi:hypothetical protein
VTLATDTKATDTISGDPDNGIIGLGLGQQDATDTSGKSGDLRLVVNRAIIYGGTVKIAFDTATMIKNGICTASSLSAVRCRPSPRSVDSQSREREHQLRQRACLVWLGEPRPVER